MADTEKITINLSVVDLGRIDLLVEQGFYSTRTDFIRTAIRKQLDAHGETIEETVRRKDMAMGVLVYNAKDLEKALAANEMLDIHIAGMVVLDKSITPELAKAAISSLSVYGVFKAPDAVKEALADRMA